MREAARAARESELRRGGGVQIFLLGAAVGIIFPAQVRPAPLARARRACVPDTSVGMFGWPCPRWALSACLSRYPTFGGCLKGNPEESHEIHFGQLN